MDKKGVPYICPVNAIRTFEVVDGLLMEQAVPEEYTLATYLMRALDARNGRDLEFMIKCYLPILIVKGPSQNQVVLVEPIGFSSLRRIPHLSELNFSSLVKRASDVASLLQLSKLMEDCIRAIDCITTGVTDDFPGVVTGTLAVGILEFLGWPSYERPEDYSLTLTGVFDQEAGHSMASSVFAALDIIEQVEGQLPLLMSELVPVSKELMNIEESAQSQMVSRLRDRLDALSETILDLEARFEKLRASGRVTEAGDVEKNLHLRRAALERDKTRLESITSKIQNFESAIEAQSANLGVVVESALSSLEQTRLSLEDLLTHSDASSTPVHDSFLLLPFIICGFTKKGRLSLTMIPPSRHQKETKGVGLRSEFIDTLEVASHSVQYITNWLTELLEDDLTFRTSVREFSERMNMLSIKPIRDLFAKGARTLVAEGVLRESGIDDMLSFLKGFPELSLPPTASPSFRAMLGISGESVCNLQFHIRDTDGRAVVGAKMQLDGSEFRSDAAGVIKAKIPLGIHLVLLAAQGFKDRSAEFNLQSEGDVVIRLILELLPPEERLDQALDRLLQRSQHISRIREKLRDAFETQGPTLLSIPAYRTALHELLEELGYEPESWIAKAMKKKGMVRRLLKRDDRIDGLRRDILRVADESRESGGLMLFSKLLVRMDDLGWSTDHAEIERVLKEMSREGLVQELMTLESGTLLVRFIPVELTNDPQRILGLADERDGRLTIEDIAVGLGWTEERIEQALKLLVDKGVAKLQKSYSTGTVYWFPGLRRKK